MTERERYRRMCERAREGDERARRLIPIAEYRLYRALVNAQRVIFEREGKGEMFAGYKAFCLYTARADPALSGYCREGGGAGMPESYRMKFLVRIPPGWLAEFARLVADGPGVPYLTVHERISVVSWDREIEKLIAILCKRAASLRKNGG